LKLLALIGSFFIRALNATLRVRHVRVENLQNAPQHILAFWHAHLLLMLHSRWRRPIAVMISRSKDGEIITRVFESYGGIHAARGSSTRGGGAALRELLREARDGNNLAFTPDGPKGPPRILKEGLIYAAQATALPIVPVAFAAKKKSSCARGIEWSCHIRSRKRSSSTGSRCTCRVTAMSRNGASAWSA